MPEITDTYGANKSSPVLKIVKISLMTIGVVVGIVLLILTIYTLWNAILVLSGSPRPEFMLRVGPAEGGGTGEIGDTFGGLLAPILTAAALAATVFFSFQQISKTGQEAERSRAEKIVAWVAETIGDEQSAFWRGVLIANDSGSPAFKVDLIVSDYSATQAATGGSFVDREAIVPPGTWFIPFQVGDRSSTRSQVDLSWRKPVPVNMDSGMSVSLVNPAQIDSGANEESRGQIQRYELTAHTPMKDTDENGEVALPYYRVHAMRYKLHGKSWWRDNGANVQPWKSGAQNETSSNTELERSSVESSPKYDWGSDEDLKHSESTPRLTAGQSTLPLSSWTRPVANMLKLVLAATSSHKDDDVIQRAYLEKLSAEHGVLRNVEYVELHGEKKGEGRTVVHSKTLNFGLEGGGTLRMGVYSPKVSEESPASPDDIIFPVNVELRDLEGNDTKKQALILDSGIDRLYRIGGFDEDPTKSIKGKTPGLYKSEHLRQSEVFWEQNQSELYSVLQAMVDKSRAILAEKSEAKIGVRQNHSEIAD